MADPILEAQARRLKARLLVQREWDRLYPKAGAYFEPGDEILYGKYKNKPGVIKEITKDERGIPTAVVEPVPKGRKKDREIGIYKFWHADPAKREAVEMSNRASVALMRMLSDIARRLGVAEHVYVVGGAVRNFAIGEPIKDIDVVIDSVSLGKDSEWFAKQVAKAIPAKTQVVTDQYGVSKVFVLSSWDLAGHEMQDPAQAAVEIANARKESYGGAEGKGYKPDKVEPATIHEDVKRREFTFNTLMWRLFDLADGPDKAEILDLTGCGVQDLKDRRMQCPSDPDTTFSDDPSRMLRAVKFIMKYGMKLTPDTEAAIRRNLGKLKNAPYEAVAVILEETLLKDPATAKKALPVMKHLGLLDTVAEMIRENSAFQARMERWVGTKPMLFLFDLMDLGLPLGSNVGFLSQAQQKRLRQVALGMPEGEPERFLEVLRQPGKVMDTRALMQEFGLQGKAISLMQKEIGVGLLLDDPSLAKDPRAFTDAVRHELRKGKVAGSPLVQLNLDLGDGQQVQKVIPSGSLPYLIDNLQVRRVAGAWIGRRATRLRGRTRYVAMLDDAWGPPVRVKLANPRLPEEYAQTFKALEEKLKYNEARFLGDTAELWLEWRAFYRKGRDWGDYVIDHTAIPPAKAKAVEMAVRVFRVTYGSGKGPRPSIADWFKKHERNLRVLLEAAQWPERSADDGIFQHGPFTVHNTVGATGKELQAAMRIIDLALRALPQTELPEMRQMAYGDLFLVGEIKRKRWAAWYMPQKDAIYLRPKISGVSVEDSALHLVHELGHRLWAKRLPQAVKSAWVTHHTQMAFSKGGLGRLPEAGEVLPPLLLVNGKQVKVDAYDELGQATLVDAVKGAVIGKVNRLKLREWMGNIGHVSKFPSIYASSDAEEHFCEALAHKGMGSLSPENLAAFDQIVLGRSRSQEVKVATEIEVAAFTSLPPGWTTETKPNGWVIYTNPAGTVKVQDTRRPHPERYQLLEWTQPTIVLDGRMVPRGRPEWLEHHGFSKLPAALDAGVKLTQRMNRTAGPAKPGSKGQVSVRQGRFHVWYLPKYEDGLHTVLRGLEAAERLFEHARYQLPGNIPIVMAARAWGSQRSIYTTADGGFIQLVPAAFADKGNFATFVHELAHYLHSHGIPGGFTNRAIASKFGEMMAERPDNTGGNKVEQAQDALKALDKEYTQIVKAIRPGMTLNLLLRKGFGFNAPEEVRPVKVVEKKGRGDRISIVVEYLEPTSDERVNGIRGDTIPLHVFVKKIDDPRIAAAWADLEARREKAIEVYNEAVIGGDDTARYEDHRSTWFPTDYSKTNKLEWLAELVTARLLAPAKMADEVREWLDHVVRTGNEPGTVTTVLRRTTFDEVAARVAARYKNKKQVPKADGNGTTTVYEYSEKQIQHRNREKAKRVEKLRQDIDKLRSQVKKDLKSDDEKTRSTALVVGLMDATYERVGNEESAKDGHYGVTGWLVKHVKFGKGKATISYVGKSGVKHEKVVDDASLVAALKKAVEGKGEDDPICEGKDCKVTASDVNAYLKPFEVTAKDIRGFHANTEVQTRLKAIRSKGGKLPEDKAGREKKLKAEFKQALEEAAKAVGHEPSTLKSQYLVPGLEDEFLKDGTVSDKLDKKGMSLDEARSLKQELLTRVWVLATKSDAEKEDEEVERMSRPQPSKKPPRQDLRRNRMEDDDPDLEGQGGDKDKDLSLNYKRVARMLHAAVLRELMDAELIRLARKVPPDEEDKREGDYWEGESGWRAWPPGADSSEPADDEEHAKTLAEGGEEGAEEDPEADPKADAAHEREKHRNEVRRRSKNFDKVVDDLVDQVTPDMAELLIDGLGTDADRQKMTEAFDTHIHVLTEVALDDVRGFTKDGLADAAEIVELFRPPPEPKAEEGDDETKLEAKREAARKEKLKPFLEASPEERGQMLARLHFAKNVIANPKVVGGRALAGRSSQKELAERGSEAATQYNKVSPEIRAEAAKNAATALETMAEDDPNRAEMESIVDGLAVAAAANGESLVVDGKELRPKMSKGHQALAKHLIKAGKQDILLGSMHDFYGPTGRAAVSEALDTMDDKELADFGKTGHFNQLSKLLVDKNTTEAQKAWIRGFLKRQGIEDMTTAQALIVRAEEASGRDLDELRTQWHEHMTGHPDNQGWQERLLKAAETGDEEESAVNRDYLVWRSKQYLEWLKLMGIDLPQGDPERARHEHIYRTGDPSLLGEVIVSQSDS